MKTDTVYIKSQRSSSVGHNFFELHNFFEFVCFIHIFTRVVGIVHFCFKVRKHNRML